MATMDADDRKRPDSGTLFSLLREEDGQFRMIVDDLRRDPNDWRSWETRTFVTHVRYPAEKLLELDFTQEQFAEMGRGLLATLLAGYKCR